MEPSSPVSGLPKASRWLLVALGLWCSGYFFTGGGASQAAHYGTARALVDQHSFTLDAYPFIDVDVARFGGHKLSNKPPGFPLLLAPAALAGKLAGSLWPGRPGTARQVAAHVTQTLGLGVMGAVILLLLAALFARAGIPAGQAPVAAAVVYLGSWLWPFSTTFFSHVATAALALGAAFLLWRAADGNRGLAPWEAVLTGFLLGYGPFIEYGAAMALLPVGLWAMLRARSWMERLLLALGAAVPVGMLLAYQAVYFGGPLDFSYAHLSTEHQVVGHAKGFLGASWPQREELKELTLGVYRGLFPPSPELLLGVLGLLTWAFKGRLAGWSRAVLVGATALTLFISGYWAWQGGSSFGPRLLLPMVPWLLVGLAPVWKRAWYVVVAAAVPGFAMMLLGPAVCMIPHASHVPGYYNLVSFLGAKFLNGQLPAYAEPIFGENTLPAADRPTLGFAYNLGHVVGLHGAWSALPFVLVTAGLVLLLGLRSRRPAR